MKFSITLLIIGIFLFIKNKDEITSFMKLQDSKVVSMILILSLFVLIYICRKNVEGLIGCDPNTNPPGRCPGGVPCPPSRVCPSGGGGGGGDDGGGGQDSKIDCKEVDTLPRCSEEECQIETCQEQGNIFQGKDDNNKYICANCDNIGGVEKSQFCSRKYCDQNSSLLCYQGLKHDCNEKAKGEECSECVGEKQSDDRKDKCSLDDFTVFCRAKKEVEFDKIKFEFDKNKFIEFKNSTPQTIYLLSNRPKPNNITFSVGNYDGNHIFQGENVNYESYGGGGIDYYIEIPIGKSLFVESSVDKVWSADIGDNPGIAFISPNEPKGGPIDASGLTALEWNIKNNELTGDISAVDGYNINANLEFFGDGKCSKRKVINTPNLECPEKFQYKTGEDKNVKTCSLKKKFENDKTLKYKDLSCPNNDCVGCDWKDKCPGWNAKDPCTRENLAGKYGCMAWWTEGDEAKEWKGLFPGDSNEQYYWAFAEQKIRGTPKGTNPYTKLKDGGVPANWPEDYPTEVDCIDGGVEMSENSECEGLVITAKKPQVVCNDLGENFLLKFTITNIME